MFKVYSRFIKTPHKKFLRLSHDFTEDNGVEFDVTLYTYSRDDLAGAFLRLDLKAYQDKAGEINKDEITTFFKGAGVEEIDIRLIRVPRVSVRAEKVLMVDRLADKLRTMAEIRNEDFPEGISLKAEKLETLPAEEIIKEVTL